MRFGFKNLFPRSRAWLAAMLLAAAAAQGQDAAADTDGDGLFDQEEFHYGLSPFSADSDSNGVADLSFVRSWDAGPAPEHPAWSVQWTPERAGTYRFAVQSERPVKLRINDVEIAAFRDNLREVIGLPAEPVTLSIEWAEPGPAGSTLLSAWFVDGTDLDADGLSLDWEMQLHTDPAMWDTDGDGLSDGEEILRYRTDPLAADSNRNGMPDYVEVFTVPAIHFVELEGFWEEKGESLAARQPAKAAVYRLPLPLAGTYRLGVVLHPDSTAAGILRFYINGELKGETPFSPDAARLLHWIEFDLAGPVDASGGRPSLSRLVRVEWANEAPGADAGELVIQQIYVDYIDGGGSEDAPADSAAAETGGGGTGQPTL